MYIVDFYSRTYISWLDFVLSFFGYEFAIFANICFFWFVDVVVGEFATCSCFNYSFVTLFSIIYIYIYIYCIKKKLFMALYNMDH
jgi:hypothetical protein